MSITFDLNDKRFIPEEEIKNIFTSDLNEFSNNINEKILITWDDMISEQPIFKRYNVFVFTNVKKEGRDLYDNKLKDIFIDWFRHVSPLFPQFDINIETKMLNYLIDDELTYEKLGGYNIKNISVIRRYYGTSVLMCGEKSHCGISHLASILSIMFSKFRKYLWNKYVRQVNDQVIQHCIKNECISLYTYLRHINLLNSYDDNCLGTIFAGQSLILDIKGYHNKTGVVFNNKHEIIQLENNGVIWREE